MKHNHCGLDYVVSSQRGGKLVTQFRPGGGVAIAVEEGAGRAGGARFENCGDLAPSSINCRDPGDRRMFLFHKG
jgi:hypothetical protein